MTYRGSAANDDHISLGSLSIYVAPDVATTNYKRTALPIVLGASARGPVRFLKYDAFFNIFYPNLQATIAGRSTRL